MRRANWLFPFLPQSGRPALQRRDALEIFTWRYLIFSTRFHLKCDLIVIFTILDISCVCFLAVAAG